MCPKTSQQRQVQLRTYNIHYKAKEIDLQLDSQSNSSNKENTLRSLPDTKYNIKVEPHEAADVEIIDEKTFSKNIQLGGKPSLRKQMQAPTTNDSKEVQVLGETNFRNRCNSLTEQSDKMYNQNIRSKNMLMNTSKVPSTTNANFLPPRRVLQPSKWLCSPYETNRINVTSEEARHYQAIMCLGSINEYQYRFAIFLEKCRVHFKTYAESFSTQGWVEGWVINAFCRKLFRDKHPSESGKHFFFHTISEYLLEQYDNEERKEYMRKRVIHAFEGAGSANSLYLTNMLFFPSLHMRHWFLFIVDMRDEKFLFLDSLFGSENVMLIRNFIAIWKDMRLPSVRFDEFQIMYPRVPKQTNRDDCGIYVMKLMEQWDPRNQPPCSFSRDDIPSIRIKYRNDLMFCKYNKLEESETICLTIQPFNVYPGELTRRRRTSFFIQLAAGQLIHMARRYIF